MSKSALCVETYRAAHVFPMITAFRHAVVHPFRSVHVPAGPINSKERFFDLEVSLVPRESCETDESRLQLLPYFVLRDEHDRIFMYSRGKGGGEARLHAKNSIGVGGHIDCLPAEGEGLLALCQREGAREIHEETGITVNPGQIDFRGVIFDASNEVGRVHLGLLAVVKVFSTAVRHTEPGIIDSGQWLDLDTLRNPRRLQHLENWSQAVVSRLASDEDEAP